MVKTEIQQESNSFTATAMIYDYYKKIMLKRTLFLLRSFCSSAT